MKAVKSRLMSIALAVLIFSSGIQLLAVLSPEASAMGKSPVKWTKYAQNPVMAGNGWDSKFLQTSSILYEDGLYKLYYGGGQTAYTCEKIGYATSPDGTSWTKYAGNPILGAGAGGSWESTYVGFPYVINDSGEYKMWYGGYNGASWNIGYATSTDGISWARYAGNPVLTNGSSGSWDSKQVSAPCVIRENGVYRMWFIGSNNVRNEYGYAESPDGITWTKSGVNPVLKVGGSGTWDGMSLEKFCVLNVSGTMRMWYRAYNGFNNRIGYANSTDGTCWTKYTYNPIMSGKAGTWERHDNMDPCVLFNGSGYKMWYIGVDNSYTPWVFKIGYAENFNTIPNAPGLVSPVDNSWAVNRTPTFGWTFSDPDQYDTQSAFQIQLDDSPDFSSVNFDSGKLDAVQTTYTAATAIPDGIYNWRARVWDIDGDNGNWSILRKIKIDFTAPLNPAGLSSRSHTIGTWSGDNTIDVNWTLPENEAQASGYGYLSIEWDTSCSTVPDIIPETTADVTCATSAPVSDGDSIYFHIRVKDNAGNWASGASHIGPFWVDATAPYNPASVTTPGHSQAVWSNDSTVDVVWSGANASLSGVAGYSFVWDNQAYTIPPLAINASAEALGVSSAPLGDGNDWYFHIRTRDNAGNWALSTVHRGPFYIDNTAPKILNFSVNGGEEFSSCRTARAIFRAEDSAGGSGLSGVRHRFNGGNWSGWESYGESFFFDMAGADSQWVVELQVRDKANNTSPTTSATILLDTTPPAVTVQINGGANITNSSAVVLSLSAEDPMPASGVVSVSFATDAKTWGNWEMYCTTRQFNLGTGDGTKTVSVRTRDAAGNIGLLGNATIMLDTQPPVTFIPMLPATVDDLRFTVNWTGADGTSGVESFDIQYSDNGIAWTDWLTATGDTSAVFSGQDGHNYSFRARARDRAGNVESYPAATKNSVAIDIPRPAITLVKPATGATLTGRYAFTGTASHPKAGLTVQKVQVRIDNGSWLDAKGVSGWTFSFDTDRLGNGKHAIAVRAFDGAKYSIEETREFRVRNQATSFEAFPVIALVLVAAIAGGAIFFLMRRRVTGRKDTRPEELQPARAAPAQMTPAPVAPPRAAVQPAAPSSSRMTVEEKVSVSDLDSDTSSGRTLLSEPAPAARAAPTPEDEISMREGKILKKLSSLPRGLPSSLWGIEMDDLASKVVSGERKDSPDGDQLVKIGNRWYFGDETNLGSFMQEYKK